MTRLRRLLLISLRNVFRNKRRTILTLLILILGCTGLVVVGGFFQSMQDRIRETLIHSTYGHLQVNVEGYFEKGAINPQKYLIKDVTHVQQQIEGSPGVLYTVPRIKLGGMLSSEDNGLSVMAMGVDPARETRMVRHQYANSKNPNVRIIEGQDLDANDPYGITVGAPLSKAMGLKIGDSVSFITTREGGAIDGAEFRIRGIFESVLKEVGERSIKMNLSTAQGILSMPDEVHSLVVVLDDTNKTESVKQALQAKLQNSQNPLEIIAWTEQGTYYQQSKALMDRIYLVIQIIMCVIFIVSIANTINMALFERMREYGTMMAMGNGRGVIFGMIILETFILGIVGSILGIGFALIISKVISSIGIDMPPLPSMTGAGAYLVMILPTKALLVQVFSIGLIATTISSVIPAYRASHFEIVRALGYV